MKRSPAFPRARGTLRRAAPARYTPSAQVVQRAHEATKGQRGAWKRGDALTVDDRGQAAVSIAQCKILATRAVLDITARIFEVTGAGGTSGKWGFDRFWRNARTLTLHDRLDYKVHDVGQWFLNGKWPTPSFYS